MWIASNLMVTCLNDGTKISGYSDSNNGKLPYYAYPQGVSPRSNKLNNYGLLYNFEAVNTGKLAPKGWHIPTNYEYTVLLGYLAEYELFNLNMGYTDISDAWLAKSLASQRGWKNSSVKGSVGNDLKANNTTGFNVYPSGYSSNGVSENIGISSGLWCCDLFSLGNFYANSVNFFYNFADVQQTPNARTQGLSVRCIRDN